MTTSAFLTPAGWVCQWYTDDDGGSGLGSNPRIAVWYDNRDECLRLASQPKPPHGCRWQPLEMREDRSPGSALWCETQGDNF